MAVLRLFAICAVVGVALWMSQGLALADQRTTLSEQELKAAALNQVVHFVRWPEKLMPDDQSPFVVGIYGEDPFGHLLEDLARGEKVAGHPIQILHCFTPEDALGCKTVYVSASNKRDADRLLHVLAGRSILTVTDDDTIAEAGAVIAFTVRSHRIHILANIAAARNSNLTLSSKLLRLAEIIRK